MVKVYSTPFYSRLENRMLFTVTVCHESLWKEQSGNNLRGRPKQGRTLFTVLYIHSPFFALCWETHIYQVTKAPARKPDLTELLGFSPLHHPSSMLHGAQAGRCSPAQPPPRGQGHRLCTGRFHLRQEVVDSVSTAAETGFRTLPCRSKKGLLMGS